MPSTYTYPGVYVEEVPSAVRTITGVTTSDTAFVDFFPRGPMNKAVRITSMEDFKRRFGGLHRGSEASYALAQYFLNGGSVAWVVRVAGGDPVAAEIGLPSDTGDSLTLRAASPGTWGKNVEVGVDYQTRDPASADEFNFVARELARENGRVSVVASEIHRNVSIEAGSPRFVQDVVNEESELVRVATVASTAERPANTGDDVTSAAIVADPADAADAFEPLTDPTGQTVSDGTAPDATALEEGLAALDAIAPHVFNILCLPAAAELSKSDMASVVTAATKFCEDKRAFFIVDPHRDVDTLDDLEGWMSDLDALRSPNAAVYFPRVRIADPLNERRPRDVGPSGTLAGVYARTDATRGIWKAPAGTEATLRGVAIPTKLTDAENGGLNPRGVNVLRTFPVFGNVAWGARTLDGADQKASEWKYVPVRRTALFIEESLYQALKWVVFEPNDEPLWSQIRLNVGAFMNDLFRQGAFQGMTAADAYFVKCDAETTTQTDIGRGIVNILVGFAPLKPAEFVVIRLQQMAGQIET